MPAVKMQLLFQTLLFLSIYISIYISVSIGIRPICVLVLAASVGTTG